MATIVEYTTQKAAENRYPERIVSPPRPGPCCFAQMTDLGDEQRDGRWVYRYRRCVACGYTVRFIVRELPDTDLIEQLRKHLATALTRNVPDY